MNDVKVSIIVPVYNVEKYLRQCLNSILAQTVTEWECILIDDGSTDGSGKICDEYVANDERISVCHQENRGVSSARNGGINKAKGKWLFFSDADDTLEPHALQILIEGTKSNCLLVLAGFNKYTEDGLLKETNRSNVKRIVSKNDTIKELYHATDFSYQGFLWCKLFCYDLVKKYKILFNEKIAFNEDRLFIIQYLCRMKGDVYYTTTPVYNYMERTTGAMSSLCQMYNRKFATDFEAFVLMKKEIYLYTKNKQLRRLALEGISSSFLVNHRLMMWHRDYDSTIHWRMLRQMIITGAVIIYLKKILIDIKTPICFLCFPQMIMRKS